MRFFLPLTLGLATALIYCTANPSFIFLKKADNSFATLNSEALPKQVNQVKENLPLQIPITARETYLLQDVSVIALETALDSSVLNSEATLEQVNQIRENLALQIPLASAEALVLHDATRVSLEAALDSFDKKKGGVWCGGAAHILTQTYRSKGIPAITLSYGFLEEGLLTHTVTLVRTKNGWFIQDPYFNLYFIDPFPTVISKLRKGEVPRYMITEAPRILHFEGFFNLDCYVQLDPESEILQIDNKHFIGKFLFDLDLFTLHWPKIEETKNSLQEKGLPKDITFLLLHPYYIFDGKQGFPIKSYEDVAYLFEP